MEFSLHTVLNPKQAQHASVPQLRGKALEWTCWSGREQFTVFIPIGFVKPKGGVALGLPTTLYGRVHMVAGKPIFWVDHVPFWETPDGLRDWQFKIHERNLVTLLGALYNKREPSDPKELEGARWALMAAISEIKSRERDKAQACAAA